MRNILSTLGFFFLIILFIAFKILVALTIVSMAIVPLTWIYAKIAGQSYNFTIDKSNMLYKLNKFGQWSLLIGGSLLLVHFII
jgi:hypothetical protein